jgi:hypothetical protein
MATYRHAHPGLDRRTLLKGAGLTAVAGALAPLAGAGPAGASGRHKTSLASVVPPRPIPGGIELPDGSVIHVWAPGSPEVTLPFTGSTLGGEDVEPSTITDFDGFSAVAFHVGSARSGDGTMYDLETDMRAFAGRYVGEDGEVHEGSFGFV